MIDAFPGASADATENRKHGGAKREGICTTRHGNASERHSHAPPLRTSSTLPPQRKAKTLAADERNCPLRGRPPAAARGSVPTTSKLLPPDLGERSFDSCVERSAFICVHPRPTLLPCLCLDLRLTRGCS